MTQLPVHPDSGDDGPGGAHDTRSGGRSPLALAGIAVVAVLVVALAVLHLTGVMGPGGH